MPNFNVLKKRRGELLSYLEQTKLYKSKTIKFVHDLKDKFNNNEVTLAEFEYRLNKALKNKSIDEWVDYYNELIFDYNKELISIDNELNNNESTIFNAKTVLTVLMFVIFGIGSLILFKPDITGFVVYNQGEIINDTLTLTIPENITINESMIRVSLSSQQSELPLNNFNVELNLITIELNKFNLIAEDGTLTAQIIFNNNIISESSLLIELQKIVQPTLEEEVVEKIIPGEEVKVDDKVNKKLEDEEKVRVLLRKKQDISKKDIEDLVNKKANLSIKQSIDDFYAVEINKNELDNLKQSKEIGEIILDEEVSLFTQESIVLTNINKVKAQGYSGQGKSVCILDTGINYNVFGLQLDNNVFGYDFINNDNDPLDDHGHGTSVANIILNVAPNTEIHAIKVIDNNGVGYYSNVLAGLQYCIDNNVDVISLSIGAALSSGYCDSDLVASKVNSAVDSGIYVVAASGNDGSSNSVRVPACASKVTRVTSSSKQDTISSFSNIFLNDLVAPGQNINTLDLNGNNIQISGTSYSAPFVSGGALLILEDRNLNPDELKYLLRSTSEIINYNNIPYNKLNLFNALINNKTNEPFNYDANVTVVGESEFGVSQQAFIIQSNYTFYYNTSTSNKLPWTVFNRTNQGLSNPPATNEALDGDNLTTCITNNLAQSDNVRCTITESGGTANSEPWIRFNFTINEQNNDITSIRIILEADNSGAELTGFIQYNRTGETTGVWSKFGADSSTEVTRTMTYLNQYDIQQVLSNITNQTILLAEGNLNDDGEQVIVDFVQVVVNVTNYTVVNSEASFTFGPQLNSTNGKNTTSRDLHAVFVASDAQNATIKYNVTWFKDNISQFTLPSPSKDYPVNTLNVSVLNQNNLSGGETWKAGIALFDGMYATYANTSELLVNTYRVYIESPTTSSPLTTNSEKNITIQYNYSLGGINQTEGVEIENVTIGGKFANILSLTINMSKRYNFSDLHENHYAFSKETDDLTVPPPFDSARDGTEVSGACYTALAQSDDSPCNTAATGSGVEPWIRFNFTITESAQNINYIRITMEAACIGGCPGGEQVEFILLNYTSGAWETWATGTVAEATREITLDNSNAFNAVIQNGQLVLLAEGNALDSGDSIDVDFVQVEVNYTANVKQEWYDGAWKVNVTVPSGLSGLQDLSINSSLNGVVRNHTQANAINIPLNNVPNNFTPIINSTTLLQLNLTTEDLQVRFNVSDPDVADTLTYNIRWFTNNRTNFTLSGIAVNNPGTAVETLTHTNTTKWQNWSVQVQVCDDQGGCSTYINTSALYIRNSNATITTPAFNQSSYNTENIINVSLVFSDDDQDLNSVTFEWFKNDALIKRTTNSNLANGTNSSDILTPDNFVVNDNIIVQAFAFDGEENSTLLNSTTITIQSANTAPNNPTNLILNSSDAAHTNKTNEDLLMIFQCDDPDVGDTLTFHLTAFRDFENKFQLQGSCNDPENKTVILSHINTTKNDNWSFSVNVSDDSGAYSATISTVVNLSILNTAPIIGNVTLDEADNINLVENGNKTLRFSFVVTDADNLTDIFNISAVANITRGFGSTAEAIRYNDTFVNVNDGGCNGVNNVGTNGKNFSCTINVVFYDEAGLWNISVRINDSVKRTDIVDYAFAQNTTKTFSINELTAFVIYPSTISFPTIGLTDTNVSARINITINNTGNDDISGRESTGETINITAITLIGETDSTTVIPTNNFSIGTTEGMGVSPAYCDPSTNGFRNVTKLINTTAALSAYNNFSGPINGSFMLAQAIGAQEILQLCLLDVPDDLTAGQNYSSSKSGTWTISIFFFRRKKNKLYEKNKNIINSIIKIKVTNNLDDKGLIRLIDYEKLVSIPISIFKNNSPLESLVKYLKENLNLSLSEISRLLNRDQRTIWITYDNASKKIRELEVKEKILIPISLFSNRKLSVLENLVYYLIKKEISLIKISSMLNRDYKTIYTIYTRSLKKLNIQTKSNIYK